jgi:hypothetical protein
VGSIKDGKVKIKNKQTGKTSWRSAKQGLVKDQTGNPSAAKPKQIDRKTHQAHSGRTNKTFKKSSGEK